MQTRYTTTQAAEQIGAPAWRVRRTLDVLEAAGIVAPERAGQYRLMTAEQVEVVREWLRRRGLLAAEASGASA